MSCLSSKSFSSTSETSSSPITPKELKALKKEKPPGFVLEVVWLSVSLFIFKIAYPGAFHALTFVTVLLPLMVYFVVSVV